MSLARSWSQDIIRRASKENGHAAATREEKKKKNIQKSLFQEDMGTKVEYFLQHLS